MSAIPRNEGESFEDYKERRANDHKVTKQALKGTLFWDSYYRGTYINPEKESKRAYKKAKRMQITPAIKVQQQKITYTA